MAQIRIRREHALGLAKARKVALQWAEEAEQKFEMDCTILEGKTGDTVEFRRSGVTGTLAVAADHFELEATLGFLLGAFRKKIESEIEGNLDALLARSSAATKPAAAKKAAARPARK